MNSKMALLAHSSTEPSQGLLSSVHSGTDEADPRLQHQVLEDSLHRIGLPGGDRTHLEGPQSREQATG